MKEYVFENQTKSDIEIRIKAYNYTQAMQILLSIVRNIEDYKQITIK